MLRRGLAGIALIATLLFVPRAARADEEEAEVTRELEARNRTRDAAERAKAGEEQERMSLRVETSRTQKRDLAGADERLRNDVDVESSRIVRKTLGVWTTVGGGLVGVTGIALYAAALTARSSIENGSLQTGADIQSAADRTRTYAPVGITFASVGIVAVGVGVALLLSSKQGAGAILRTRTSGGLNLDPRSGQLTW